MHYDTQEPYKDKVGEMLFRCDGPMTVCTNDIRESELIWKEATDGPQATE